LTPPIPSDAVAQAVRFGGNAIRFLSHAVNSGDVIPIARRPTPGELQTTSVSDPPVRDQRGQNDEFQWPPPYETQNHQKRTSEFGLSHSGQTLVSLLVFITDIHTLGLAAAQGLRFVTGFYWDRDNDTRAWSKRFFDRHGRMPTSAQASVYSAIRHHLRAIEAAGTDAALPVMAKMREISVDDFYSRGGRLREDGRLLHDMYFVQVKTPAESTGPWDYYKIIATIPGEQAFRPADEDGCPLIKR
jgi:hypothetical protein